jgi:hypothetical protein
MSVLGQKLTFTWRPGEVRFTSESGHRPANWVRFVIRRINIPPRTERSMLGRAFELMVLAQRDLTDLLSK